MPAALERSTPQQVVRRNLQRQPRPQRAAQNVAPHVQVARLLRALPKPSMPRQPNPTPVLPPLLRAHRHRLGPFLCGHGPDQSQVRIPDRRALAQRFKPAVFPLPTARWIFNPSQPSGSHCHKKPRRKADAMSLNLCRRQARPLTPALLAYATGFVAMKTDVLNAMA
jgi:hypothetical protein